MRQAIILRIDKLPRFWKRSLLICFDILALAFALWASFSLRYGSWTPPRTLDELAIVATGPLVAIPIFIRFGLYRAVIRYLPERALWTILQATTLAAICWVLVVFLSEMSGRGALVPRSVPILYWAIATILVGSSRYVAKKLLWPADSQIRSPIAVYGAGEAGAQLVNILRRQGSQRIVAFLDDNATLHGRDVAGIRVFKPSAITGLVEKYGVQEVILSAPSISTARRQSIVTDLSNHRVKIRTVPAMADLVSGKYTINNIREIDIDELLGRSSVPPDRALLQTMIEGKSIMVTGAGGSIGSELCRLIIQWAPQRLVLFESNEFALYKIERELVAGEGPVVPVLGTITDASSVNRALVNYGVQVVFHAAAHKHVPLVEANALEGIRNNVLGTKTVVDAAFEHGVESFVLISSDKAVRPTNVMGATKRWAELLVHDRAEHASGSGRTFSAVRFGNVLGSNGSVVPLFKEQISRGGPVTLTDAAMTRYFMSIHEAAELIVQAGALSTGGDVFLLDMGPPVLISDLAENMIHLAGLSVRDEQRPHGDIEIVVTGKRPGEKMYEELFYDPGKATDTIHPKIMRGQAERSADVDAAYHQLMDALAREHEPDARRILFDFIS